MWQDLRIAFRALRHHPGFSLVAIFALALGIGANTAMFSMADGLLFRPILINNLDRLITVIGGRPGVMMGEIGISPADFYDLAQRVHSIEAVTSWTHENWNVTGEGNPEVVRGATVHSNFFNVLATQPAQGRGFRDNDPTNVTVLSHELWQRRFGGDPTILGKVIRLNGKPHEVLGIAAPAVKLPASAQLWVPVAETPEYRHDTGSSYLNTIARLRPGVTLAEANAELRLLASQLAVERPKTNAEHKLEAWQLSEFVSGYLTGTYTRLSLISVTLLLLIACANVANLLFARVSGRVREIALRQALGASRFAIIRQLLAESVLLAIGGLVVSFFFSLWGVDTLKGFMPAEVEVYLPGWSRISVDGRAALYSSLMAMLASVAAGILPAWIGSRAALTDALREGGRGMSSGLSRHNLRRFLVVGQVTTSLVLIIGGALMYRGARALFDSAPGRDREHTLTAQLVLDSPEYENVVKRVGFQDRLLERLHAIRGVDKASLVRHIPFSGAWSVAHLTVEGELLRTGEQRTVHPQRVNADYLESFGIPLQKGRLIQNSDTSTTQQVAVISEKTARLYFGDADPIGKRIQIDHLPGQWFHVVGVVGDILHEWTQRGAMPTVYLPYRQASPVAFAVLLHSSDRAATDIATDLRAVVRELDSELALQQVLTHEKVVGNQLVGMNYIAAMLAMAAILSLLLAAIGIYSLMSYVVSERVREVGIRMALGASAGSVVRLIVGQGFRMIAVGLFIGMAGALAMSKLLSGLIYGVSAFDMVALLGGALLLAAAGLVAAFIPARWASHVDPMTALRRE